MAYEACLDEIKRATGLADMSSEEAQSIMDAVNDAAERIMRERRMGGSEALQAAAKELAEKAATVRERYRFVALQDLQKRMSRRGRIIADGPEGIVDGIRAELHGVNSPRSIGGW